MSRDSVKEEEKTPPKKYAIKLPRDLTSRFEQGEEMKRKEVIKAEGGESAEAGGDTPLGGSTVLSPQAMNSAPEKGLLGMGKQTQATKGCVYEPPGSNPSSLFQKPHLHPARRESQWWSATC